MAPNESTIASAAANTVGTTNSTLLTLRIIAHARSDKPPYRKPLFVESGNVKPALRFGTPAGASRLGEIRERGGTPWMEGYALRSEGCHGGSSKVRSRKFGLPEPPATSSAERTRKRRHSDIICRYCLNSLLLSRI